MDFRKYKSKLASVETLAEKLDEQNNKKSFKDPNEGLYWEPTVGKNGNGRSKIRFLPVSPVDIEKAESVGIDIADLTPYVKTFDYFFQGPTGQWYVNKSRTTIKEPDPCNSLAGYVWKSEDPLHQMIKKTIKRQMNFISNVYVYSDDQKPEFDENVWLYKYGPAVMHKIEGQFKPKREDREKCDVFDFIDGADFDMFVTTKEITVNDEKMNARNYDECEFIKKPFMGEDSDKINEVWNKQHSLYQFIDPEKFKPWDQLKDRLEKVFGLIIEYDDEFRVVNVEENKYSKPAGNKVTSVKETKTETVDDSESVPFETDDDDDDFDSDKILERIKNIGNS